MPTGGSQGSPVLLFDGDCGFCTASVDWLTAHLPAPPTMLPLQHALLEGYGLTREEAERKVQLVVGGERFAGAGAVSAMFRHQPQFLWRFAGWLMRVPPLSWVADSGYAVVSHFRHLLPGVTPANRR